MTEVRHHIDDIPEDAIPVGVVEVVSYLRGDGKSAFVLRVGGDMDLSQALGLMELSKAELIRAYGVEDSEEEDVD